MKTRPIGNTAGPFSAATQRLEPYRFAIEGRVALEAETPFQISKGKPEIAHKLPDNPTPDQVVITHRGAGGRG